MVGHVDGYLCALKDAQIRGGLHVLGQPPAGEALVDTVLAITRQPQGERAVAAGHRRRRARASTSTAAGTRDVDRVEAECRRPGRGPRRRRAGIRLAGAPATTRRCAGSPAPWCPTCGARPTSSPTCSRGLAGRHVPAGPSGAPTRGGAHVLPTGRNFYSVDPKAMPVPAGLGRRPGAGRPARRAARGRDRHVAPHRRPGRVGHGQHAHPGRRHRRGARPARRPAALARAVRPRRPGSRSIPLAELGRPRVDVTVRISGFFRDAFPDVVDLLDDAVRLVGRPRRAAGRQPGPRPSALDDARVFGPAPGRLRLGHLPGDRGPGLAHDGRPGRGLPGLVGLRLPPRGGTASPTPSRSAAASPPSRWR